MSKSTARFTLDPAFTVGEVDPRIFGSFVEHLGRCVYTGVFEPGHPAADAAGLRTDVLDLVRELGVTAVRYPGGNFVSGYRWEDSVGPVEDRPRRLDLAWHSTETNRFGLAEFIAFLRAIGPQAEPMMAVNLGTRGVAEALELQEYANHPSGSALADLRAAHGDKEPYGIRMWCLGNEMDGPWQTGHKTAREYGRLAAETARAMRQLDPGVELVACGSSSQSMPTFASWEATVLEETYDLVDLISLHAYYEPQDGDLDSFLASAVDMESFIDNVVATCDHVGARLKSKKKIKLSFDEWNVWYTSRWEAHAEAHDPADWPQAPRLLEDDYSVLDAVVFGSLLIALLRHADRVAVACLAQLVNVIAPIMTEPGGPAWRQTTFFPFAQASRHGRGQVLDVRVDSPTHDTRRFGETDLLHATAVRADDGTVTVFAVNRSRTAPLPLEVALTGLGTTAVVEHSVLADADPDARNTLREPDRVVPHPAEGTSLTDGVLRAVLEPLSWNVIRLA
ncbi:MULTISPECIES: arabinosylfuranosidase ArfA [Streptomyces]|uniref:non-reducing end alpha-L-arabinofuranosidase n=1 Tax=Streptomyces doudnae TaxID=3075536 RepID=A0ABD5F140_9ACTN|nr:MULTISPECIES: alpha-N-arabinofuranosidase [unclassified Streptomyces]MDT0440526.1 alpha-N-arabinofuranosidase [Streptomyces sp. DSM 41981]MYQ65141.1 alpha-N-arabinofuranosidase [Streptomyces sp. SID4950]SCD93571.1 alpha-N-arabinofuranosidase [Streptomyces sp. SolWspMP-5a-2]